MAKHSPSSSCTAKRVKRILQFVLYNFPFLYFYFSSVSARLNESSPSAKLNAASRSQHIADPCQRFSQRVAFLFVLPTGFPHATHDVTANTQAASCGFSLTGQLTSGNSQIQQLATCNLQLADAAVVFDRFVWLMPDPNRLSCLEIHWVIQCNNPAGLSHNSANGDKRVTI